MDTFVRATRRDRAVRRHDWRQFAGRRKSTAPSPLPTARWVPPGERVTVRGYDLPDGMVYVGSGQTEPSCLDADLDVGGLVDDRADLGFWPSYAGIAPAERAAYLRWLSSGRRTPDVSIGYVFLFFYGLERRVVQDRFADQEFWAEVPLLQAEGRALLEVYGEQPAFRRYAVAFLDLLELMAATNRPSPDEFVVPERGERRWPAPVTIRRALSAHVVHGRPIPADWALAWAWHGTEVDWSGVAHWAAFELHFATRYEERYGEGLVLRPTKRPLRVRYEPASSALEATAFPRRDLPEAFGRESRRELTAFVQCALDEFDQPEPHSADYPAAVTFVELAMALSGKDGLVDLVSAALQLGEADRRKLEAHVRNVRRDLEQADLAGQLAGLSASLRAAAGELLIQAVATGRLVLPPQVAQLLASYRWLGLDPATVPRLLHASLTERHHRTAWKVTAPAPDPVVVRRRRWSKDDYLLPPPEPANVPPPPKKKPAYKPLDTAAIQAKLAETATVSALLHDIFTEEPEPPPTQPVTLVAGLDAAHSELLHALAERPTWTQEEFDGLASKHGLLPAGALDVLNEAALEAADDPVLNEGAGGDLELDTDVLQELLS